MIPPAESVLWAGACWPVPVWKGETPVVSDEFSRYAAKDPRTGKQVRRQHLGVDIMFKNRRAAAPLVPVRTKWFHCDGDVPMLAMLAGRVCYARLTPTGMSIHLDHGARYGAPLVTYYTHMQRLLVRHGEHVIAGQPIGVIGNSPKTDSDPNHAHIEIWDYSRGPLPRVSRCVDPEPYLKRWGKLRLKPGTGTLYTEDVGV